MSIPPIPLPAALVEWVPVPLLHLLLGEAMAIMQRRHPEIAERLAGLGDTIIRIEPEDLRIAFDLAVGPSPDRPWLQIASCRHPGAAAVIRGSFGTLLDLLEGRSDGDGLFFARALAVEGDMEIVVGLRNALDGEDIDIVEDFLSALGPLGPPLAPVARLLRQAAASPRRVFGAEAGPR